MDDLKILLTLKFVEKHSAHLRRSRQSQSVASTSREGRGRGCRTIDRDLCAFPPIYINQVSLKGTHIDCLLCGHHGIVLTIKIISVYSKTNFFKKE